MKTKKMPAKRINLKFIYIPVILFLAFFLALRYDAFISKFFESVRFQKLNYFMFAINFLSSDMVFFLIVSAIFLSSVRIRNLLRVWITLILTAIAGIGVKTFFSRPRPFQAGVVATFANLIENSFSSWNTSFPSLHSATIFSVIPFFFEEKRIVRNSWIVFAVLVSLSRIYLGVHYLSDIIFGASMGYGIGYLIFKISHRKIKK